MQRIKSFLLIQFLLFPFAAFANGYDALVPVVLQIGSIFIFIIGMAIIKLSLRNMIKLMVVYSISLAVLVYIMWDDPYTENRTVINIAWSIGPLLMTLLCFLMLKKRKRNKT